MNAYQDAFDRDSRWFWKSPRRLLFIGLALLFPLQTQALDVTSSIEFLGNPTEGTNLNGRAQSVWDLQAFDGRLYLGHGNTTTNPGSNALWSFTPGSDTFANELTINSEAVETFRVINDRLYVPAADPVTGDSQKFYYRDAGSAWQSVSGNPQLAHVRDVIDTGSDLLLVGNTRNPGTDSGIATSNYDGSNLSLATTNPVQYYNSGVVVGSTMNFHYSGLNYSGQTLVTSLRFDYSNRVTLDSESNLVVESGIGTYDASTRTLSYAKHDFFDPLDENTVINDRDFLPDTAPSNVDSRTDFYSLRFNSYAENDSGVLVYSLRSYSIFTDDGSGGNPYQELYQNNHNLWVKTQLQGSPTLASFSDAPAAEGEDVLLIDGVFYALANEVIADDSFVISVHSTATPEDNSTWEELFHFSNTSRAKSFEYLDDAFYFGLGADLGEDVINVGNLYRYQFAIPEPSSTLLLLLGLSFMLLKRRHR